MAPLPLTLARAFSLSNSSSICCRVRLVVPRISMPPAICGRGLLSFQRGLVAEPERQVRDHRAPRVFLGSSDSFRPAGSGAAAACATRCWPATGRTPRPRPPPRCPCSPSASSTTSGVGAISARSRLGGRDEQAQRAVGGLEVRGGHALHVLRRSPARSRSRCRNSRRQSPMRDPLAERAGRRAPPSSRPSSICVSSVVRARSTSSAVSGLAAISSTVCDQPVARAVERRVLAHLRGEVGAGPGHGAGSCQPKIWLAFLVSTSALYSRPEGVSPSTSVSTSMAAKSGSEPAGTW